MSKRNLTIMIQTCGEQSLRLSFSEHFQLGVPDLDREHSEMIDILNSALEPDRDAAALVQLLHRLSAMYMRHCRTEEVFLDSIGYARLDAHPAMHLAFHRKIEQCCQAFGADAASARQTLDTLCHAFIDHLLYDIAYKSYLVSRTSDIGISGAGIPRPDAGTVGSG